MTVRHLLWSVTQTCNLNGNQQCPETVMYFKESLLIYKSPINFFTLTVLGLHC